MSETGLVMVIFMVLTVMIVMSYSRQILLFMVAVAISLFCLGVYWLFGLKHGSAVPGSGVHPRRRARFGAGSARSL